MLNANPVRTSTASNSTESFREEPHRELTADPPARPHRLLVNTTRTRTAQDQTHGARPAKAHSRRPASRAPRSSISISTTPHGPLAPVLRPTTCVVGPSVRPRQGAVAREGAWKSSRRPVRRGACHAGRRCPSRHGGTARRGVDDVRRSGGRGGVAALKPTQLRTQRAARVRPGGSPSSGQRLVVTGWPATVTVNSVMASGHRPAMRPLT